MSGGRRAKGPGIENNMAIQTACEAESIRPERSRDLADSDRSLYEERYRLPNVEGATVARA